MTVSRTRSSDDLLAAAVLAGDQHAARSRRGAADLLIELLHRIALPEEKVFEREMPVKVADLLAKPLIGERMAHGQQHALE